MVPDLTGLPALDVLLGMAFVYFLLSVAVSAVTEMISGIAAMRARMLERAIGVLLAKDLPTPDDTINGEKSKQVWEKAVEALKRDQRILALYKEPGRRSSLRPPSYIPARVFIAALLSPVCEGSNERPDLAKIAESWDLSTVVAAMQTHPGPDSEMLKKISNPTIRAWVIDAVSEVQETVHDATQRLAVMRKSLEASFDEYMRRVSGWYKRWSQIVVVIVAVALVAVVNADSLAIGQRLWNDDAVRAAIATQAQQLAEGSGVTCTLEDKQADKTSNDPLEKAGQCVEQVDQLSLPLGWGSRPNEFGDWVAKVLGLLFTAIAVSFGAPFWFDVLGKVSHLRNTGKRETAEPPPAEPTTFTMSVK